MMPPKRTKEVLAVEDRMRQTREAQSATNAFSRRTSGRRVVNMFMRNSPSTRSYNDDRTSKSSPLERVLGRLRRREGSRRGEHLRFKRLLVRRCRRILPPCFSCKTFYIRVRSDIFFTRAVAVRESIFALLLLCHTLLKKWVTGVTWQISVSKRKRVQGNSAKGKGKNPHLSIYTLIYKKDR